MHQLSDYEKFDVLIKMEPMGGRKPSQLLHAMLEFCPVGMEKHQALLTQLGEVQPGDPRGLAAQADRLWSVHAPSGGVAGVTDEQDGAAAVAAVKPAARGRGGKFRGRGGGRGGQQATAAKAAASGSAGAAGTPAADPTPTDLARMSSGLCFYHWAFADKAGKCVPPCTWGN